MPISTARVRRIAPVIEPRQPQPQRFLSGAAFDADAANGFLGGVGEPLDI